MEIRHFPRNFDGLTVLQLRIIAVLDDVSGVSIQGLADILSLSYAEAWENVKVLSSGRGGNRHHAGRGLITVLPGQDKRKRSLFLTDSGEQLAGLLELKPQE